MRYLTILTALAASGALAKTKAKVNHSANPTKLLTRSPAGAVAARQDASGEFCGTDGSSPSYLNHPPLPLPSLSLLSPCSPSHMSNPLLDDGLDWYCDDPSTACCTGDEVWQCAPIVAEECCTTGYYCDAGTHCYMDLSGEQLCLTPEEAEDMGGDAPPEDDVSSGSGGRGGGGAGSGTETPTRKAGDAEETTGPSDLGAGGDEDDEGTTSETSEEEDDDDGTSVAVGGGKKGRKGSGSGAGSVAAGKVMAGVAAVGVLALV